MQHELSSRVWQQDCWACRRCGVFSRLDALLLGVPSIPLSYLQSNSAAALMAAIAVQPVCVHSPLSASSQHHPVTYHPIFCSVVTVVARTQVWQGYQGGVVNAASCYGPCTAANAPSCLDHQVLAVGYGTDPVRGDYWLVKVREWLGKVWCIRSGLTVRSIAELVGPRLG